MHDFIAQQSFGLVADLIARHAAAQPGHVALVDGTQSLDYAGLDRAMDQVALALQQAGIQSGEAIAICAASSVPYATVFMGALRAGVVVAPLAPGVTPQSLAQMMANAQARLLFTDAASSDSVGPATAEGPQRIALDGSGVGKPLAEWLAPAGQKPAPATVTPTSPFNIIYSSGTTGEPKGIVQSHGMRWSHVQRGVSYEYGPGTVTLLSTPLYSNTTLVLFFPTLAFGGTVLLMAKFNAAEYLKLAQAHRVTHTMLVPVQYQRILALPGFGDFDLSSFRYKFCTSAPFSAAMKAEVLQRWPGGLIEFYGMTEGGGSCILEAHVNPDKLHTVGRPAATSDIRLIDDAGHEVPAGEAGEVVGHSPGMMTGYHRKDDKTREAEWFDPSGKRFIRTGDIGRFDADGFLILFDRKKDMIISGGFNIYPSDLEGLLREHPAVLEAAVVGVPSEAWGETPVAFVVAREGEPVEAGALKDWLNERVGKTQRLSQLVLVDSLPRSAIGKILKRELRDRWVAPTA
ncbi:class I adenylate-forming enzyme family protein [Pseudorhodoferax sp. Leaf267]|uniref:class I adenylate-forming enzyme family protein n=1 Tax=Pseudorhodoferax sp. Leaf267 TaxID=1736316 RepID=UPI0006F5ED3E|nr:class I adenylate-forming enzyme family protein [Pseudorhodoferax sp. Leaf267]KQP12851.1 4-coumarate--CoA ligase [Pseudorhodoferax sp. Leaf267]